MSGLQNYKTDYQQIQADLPGQSLAWLQQIRIDAFSVFSDTGFPSLREEEWRYTNISAIEKKLFSPSTNVDSNAIDQAWLDSFCLKDAYTLVIINGRFSKAHSSLKGLPETVTILSMGDALEQNPELVEKYLTKAVANEEHSFVAFNSAWFSDGLFVHVPVKQVLDKPVQLIHLVTQADCLAVSRNILIVEDMAQVEVIETFVGDSNAYLTASVTEIFVEKNADLTLYKMQNEGDKAYHFGGTYVKQAKHSRFKHHNFAFGSLLARNDVHTDLDMASECDLNGLYIGVKRQHIDNHTRIKHMQPHAISKEMYKGILNQRAKGVFQGLVFVAEDAQKTDSVMNNRNLLLSNDAEADAKPQLKIYADDVKCAHGVTVGQLDEKSIFYLKSRAIDEATARNMLTFAFANEMVGKVDNKELHTMLLGQLLQRFSQKSVDEKWL
ncbi:MAG: Fe-S cluster assembly protein SufD [Methylococcales symbiont of Hymedesmia sp. n. MRB-2018]|nr:MAG: Fe-S cluster assembly protein SufD [Methylococcales symbiont of Hymedesmia sp. n. MRB-2018]KAF3983595.1 MAG: Fe-S cluster assembly protein SufD [Methylococcales symbiont of Hymedesmia sp. n. MRB-2018]